MYGLANKVKNKLKPKLIMQATGQKAHAKNISIMSKYLQKYLEPF
jgi:hypothetical protein